MSQQMESGNEAYQRQEPPYGRYEGTQGTQGQGTPPHVEDNWHAPDPPPAGNMYDDSFMDAFAQRLSQRMAQGPSGKVYSSQRFRVKERASAGQRLALAIVSVVMMVPLSGIVVGIIAASHLWLVGLLALGAICLTLIIINAIFNYSD